MSDACRMRSAFFGLAAATVTAWLFFLLYMGALTVSLARLGGTTGATIPALLVGGAGLLGSAFVGFSRHVNLSRPARVVLELLLLAGALFLLTIVLASRGG
jgi:hypothetical protein